MLDLCASMVYNGCMEKVRINFALTKEARDILRLLATVQGISMTALLEILIRESGKKEKRNASEE